MFKIKYIWVIIFLGTQGSTSTETILILFKTQILHTIEIIYFYSLQLSVFVILSPHQHVGNHFTRASDFNHYLGEF